MIVVPAIVNIMKDQSVDTIKNWVMLKNSVGDTIWTDIIVGKDDIDFSFNVYRALLKQGIIVCEGDTITFERVE